MIEQWIAEPPPDDVRRALQRLARTTDVRRIAVMPDVHLAKEVCVGVAVGTSSTIYPAAVVGDIGCGMAAVAFDADASTLASSTAAASLLDRLYRTVPIGRQRRADAVRLPDELDAHTLGTSELEATKRREARLQFGTLGRGNHFLELQADEDDRLWLMVHSGSRGMGQAIREAYEQRGERERTGLAGLPATSELGRAYLADVAWASAYAACNRARMMSAVQEAMRDLFRIEAAEATTILCEHNFVRRETHAGEELWVHRKGAISARTGERGIIPGSMGAPSFHVEGRGCEASLCSSSHGAGRSMSRAVARRRLTAMDVTAAMAGIWFDHRLAGRLVEEAPAAYKDIGAVMRAQKQLTKVRRRLRPLLAFKGG